MARIWQTFLAFIGVSALCACIVAEPPSGLEDGAEDRRGPSPAGRYHTVVRGDTLYGIAFRYGLDYRAVARRNGIGPPFRIYPGQRLTLGALAMPRSRALPPVEEKRAGTHRPGAVTRAPTQPSARRSTPARPAATGHARADPAASGAIRWQWPARGRLQAVSAGSGKQGLEILGASGEAVRAAASGQVVYSGDGLVGYGRLIIIKHDDTYFSAYAHNRRLLVREGIRVSGGQAIAEMGSTGTNQIKLYFEIRRNGKAVPPQDYLPERPTRSM